MKRLLFRIPSIFAICLAAASCTGRLTVSQADVDWSRTDTVICDSDDGMYIEREAAFDSIWFVRLETDDKGLIGRPDVILFADSTIVVADMNISKNVLMFKYDGSFIGQLAQMGNGHNEFLYLSYVSLDGNGNVSVLDEVRGKILTFTERGQFLNERDCSIYANAFEYADNDVIVFDTGLRYHKGSPYDNISFVVKDGKMNDSYVFGLTDFEEGFNYTRSRNLYSYGGSVYGNVNFDDIIYRMDSHGVSAAYRLIIRPDNASDYFPFKDKEEIKNLYRKHTHFNGSFIELEDYSYFGISIKDYEKQMPDLLYNHRTGQSHMLLNSFNDPMMSFFVSPLTRFGDNCLVCVSSANNVLNTRGAFETAGSEYPFPSNLFEGLEADSNPILFFYRLAY